VFVICGEALIDIFVNSNEKTNPYQFPLQACVGGSPFNVAIGLARLGQKSSLLTGLSNDMFGKHLGTVLNKEGVSLDLIIEKQLPTTVAFIEKDNEGIPTYSFLGEGAADRSLLKDDVNLNLNPNKDTPVALHFGSYTLVAQPTADSFLSLAKQFSGKSLISLDPNIRAIVEPDMDVWRNRVDKFVQLADIVKVSDEDLSLMYPNTNPETIIEKWLTKGLKMIVLTRGGEGSSLWSQQNKVDVVTPKITVIDTVGAGDTYQAAILDWIAELIAKSGDNWSKDLTEAKLSELGEYAAAAAAITCSRQGADLPSKSEIASFMA